uniref:DNA-directed DNA polymerase n=1 Tax=Romanomermis culicivorax TaxID=13658 RepID=A0A915J4C2_ROMCU
MLEESKICKNSSKCALSKLMLNSFWGKFGQVKKLSKTVIVDILKEHFDISITLISRLQQQDKKWVQFNTQFLCSEHFENCITHQKGLGVTRIHMVMSMHAQHRNSAGGQVGQGMHYNAFPF